MANSCVHLTVAVLVLLVADQARAGVMASNDYEADPLLRYQPPQRLEVPQEPNNFESDIELKCCAKCIYIPGYGCYDPTDPSEYPPLLPDRRD